MKEETTRGKVSIVIPAYNAASTVGRCLDSVLAQSYRDIEVIVVDDGSTDGTLAVCRDRERRDDRLIVVHQANGGVSAARNTALRLVTGRWLCFVDSDDYVTPRYVARLVCHAAEGRFVLMDKRDRFESGLAAERAEMPAVIIRNFLQLGPWNKMLDAETVRRHGITFPEGITSGEDFVFMCRYMEHANDMIALPDSGDYIYERNPNATSLCNKDIAQEERNFAAMRDEWQRLLAATGAEGDIDEMTWRSSVRTRFEWLLYSIVRQNASFRQKYAKLREMSRHVRPYALYAPIGGGRHDIAMWLLRREFYAAYLLFNAFLEAIGKPPA